MYYSIDLVRLFRALMYKQKRKAPVTNRGSNNFDFYYPIEACGQTRQYNKIKNIFCISNIIFSFLVKNI